MQPHRLCLAACAVVTAASLGFSSAFAGSAVSSSADGIGAQFQSPGVSTHLGPVGLAKGSAPPGYDNAIGVGFFKGSVDITPSVVPAPTLFVTASSIKSHVSGGFGIDTLSGEGDNAVGTATLTLMLNPPPPGPVPRPFLQITISKVKSRASIDEVLPSTTPTTGGSATIGSVTVSGSLVGDLVFHFSGTPAPNTTLVSNSALTITLNDQDVSGTTSCLEVCRFIPTGITTDAIHVKLTKANLDGRIVSGDIEISRSKANLPGT
jgi:hypothetical protein